MEFPSTRPGGWDGNAPPIPVPLCLYEVTVPEEWVDYNQHMSEWCYLLTMGNSSDAFFRYVGIDDDYRDAGASLFTVETHIHNLREASLSDRLRLTLLVLGHDGRRVHLAHEVRRVGENTEGDDLVAAGEQMLLHVNTAAGRVVEPPAELTRRLDLITAAHRAWERPDWLGHVIGIPGPPHITGGA